MAICSSSSSRGASKILFAVSIRRLQSSFSVSIFFNFFFSSFRSSVTWFVSLIYISASPQPQAQSVTHSIVEASLRIREMSLVAFESVFRISRSSLHFFLDVLLPSGLFSFHRHVKLKRNGLEQSMPLTSEGHIMAFASW